jgi:endo-alpha-1,4-polygalactosaminidase (GH114 family)
LGAPAVQAQTTDGAAPPSAATRALEQRLRDLGLAPEQESMDPQGLYDRPGTATLPPLRARGDGARRPGEGRPFGDPGEPLLSVPGWLVPAYRDELRLIVRELVRYARTRQPNFAVLARGAAPLAFRTRREAILDATRATRAGGGAPNPDSPAAGVGALSSGFIGAIDGLVMDGQFCGDPPVLPESIMQLQDLNLTLISIDHCADEETAAKARLRAAEAGVLSFVDTDPDGRLDTIVPTRPENENAESITDVHQARSVLVLEDASAYGDVSLLIGALSDTNHDILILDPFVLGETALGQQQIRTLRHKKLGARRLVLALFDVAMAHETAYYWEPDWTLGNPRWLSAAARDRPGAYFTEFWDPAWKALLGEFFVAVMDLGFDGVVLEGFESVHRWEAISPVE